MKKAFYLAFIFVSSYLFGQDGYILNHKAKEKLDVPFGSVVEIEAEIIDGQDFLRKELQGRYLLKIIKIDTIVLSKPIMIDFKDETRKFPEDNFELYELIYGEKVGTLNSKTIEKMKHHYIGKKLK